METWLWPGLCLLCQFLFIPPTHSSGSADFLPLDLLHKPGELYMSALPVGPPSWSFSWLDYFHHLAPFSCNASCCKPLLCCDGQFCMSSGTKSTKIFECSLSHILSMSVFLGDNNIWVCRANHNDLPVVAGPNQSRKSWGGNRLLGKEGCCPSAYC